MTNIPTTWIEPELGTVADVNPRKDVDLDGDELVTFVPMAAVDEVSGTIAAAVDRPYREVSTGFTQFRNDDVIFAKITPSMENGKSAVARGLTNGIGIGSTEFHVFRSNGSIDPEYLWRFVRQKSFREDAQAVMSGAVGQQRVPTEYLRTHPVPLPPLAEQQRIVAKLDGLIARTGRARTDLDRIPTLVTRYKQRILALAAEGSLTADWRTEHAAGEWARVSVSKIAAHTFDGPFGSNLKSSDYVDSGVRVVRLENIGILEFIRSKETFISDEKFEKMRRHELHGDDVLFSSFISESIRVCLFPKDLETKAINKADCFCIRTNENVCLPQFLAFRLASPTTFEDMKDAVHGATRPRISLSYLKGYEFGLPSLEEQSEIVRRLGSAFGWLDRMAADYRTATTLLPRLDAAILAKAFRGELVSQEPGDEPASALLERSRGRRPEVRKQSRTSKPRKSQDTAKMARRLIEVLNETADWLPAQEAFRRCGVADGAKTEEIEGMYAELRALDKAGRISVEPVLDPRGRKLHDRLKLRGR